ncbi:Ras-GEF domain-containing protein [Entamoeba marina]
MKSTTPSIHLTDNPLRIQHDVHFFDSTRNVHEKKVKTIEEIKEEKEEKSFALTIYMLIEKKTSLESLIPLFECHNFSLFKKDEVDDDCDIRMEVWMLDVNRRLVLENVCKRYLKGKLEIDVLMKLIFGPHTIVGSSCYKFLCDILDNTEEIFNNEGDPTFDNETGKIVSLSTQKLFDLALLPNEDTTIYINAIICTAPLFITGEEFLTKIINICQVLNTIEENEKLLQLQLKKQDQIQKIIMGYVNMHEPLNDSCRQRLLKCINPMFFSKFFVKKIHSKLHVNLNDSADLSNLSTKSLIKSRPSFRNRHRRNSSSSYDFKITIPQIDNDKGKGSPRVKNEDTFVVNESIFTTLDKRLVAEQLILYDVNEMKKIEMKELLLHTKSNQIQIYIRQLNKIEMLLEPMICNELNELNITHLIFSVIVQKSLSLHTIFESIQKSSKEKYDRLYQLFSINKNHSVYRNHYDSLLYPKIPVLSLWLKDMIALDELPIGSSDSLNFDRLILTSNKLIQYTSSQIKPYSLMENSTFVKFLRHLQ